MANELEPRGELEGRFVEHSLQAVGSDVSSIADFVEVGLEVDVCLDEENVVDWISHATSVYFFCSNKTETHSHALPIFHHSVPCSGFLSRT